MKTVRTLLWVGALLIVGSAATSQTLINHVSPGTVAAVQARFIRAFKEGGISGVVRDIRSCYAATSGQRTAENENAVAACLLYDYSAMLFNEDMVRAMVAEGMPHAADDPPAGSALAYLTGAAFEARLEIYAGIPFGEDTHAFGPYFGDAPNTIVLAVDRSIAR